MPVTELLNLENLRQFSAGMNILLPFSIDRADTSQPINDGDDWEVRIVKPRGGGMLIKTAGLDFPDDTVSEISVPVEPLDFDRNGTYYYQVIKTTGAAVVKSDVREFNVKPSLPTGLPISPPTSPFEFGIPFFNTAGASVVSPSFLRYEDTENEEFFYVRGRKAANAFRFEFDGWNGTSYTDGMYIKSTNAAGYSPKHLILESGAYSSKFNVSVSDKILFFGNEMANSEYRFGGYYGNYVPIIIKTGGTTHTTPRVKMQSFTVNDVVAEFRAYAGQTANIWEYRKSDDSILSALTASGAILLAQFSSDSLAPNNSIYWESTSSKLQYKDPSGSVTNLF